MISVDCRILILKKTWDADSLRCFQRQKFFSLFRWYWSGSRKELCECSLPIVVLAIVFRKLLRLPRRMGPVQPDPVRHERVVWGKPGARSAAPAFGHAARPNRRRAAGKQRKKAADQTTFGRRAAAENVHRAFPHHRRGANCDWRL